MAKYLGKNPKELFGGKLSELRNKEKTVQNMMKEIEKRSQKETSKHLPEIEELDNQFRSMILRYTQQGKDTESNVAHELDTALLENAAGNSASMDMLLNELSKVTSQDTNEKVMSKEQMTLLREMAKRLKGGRGHWWNRGRKGAIASYYIRKEKERLRANDETDVAKLIPKLATLRMGQTVAIDNSQWVTIGKQGSSLILQNSQNKAVTAAINLAGAGTGKNEFKVVMKTGSGRFSKARNLSTPDVRDADGKLKPEYNDSRKIYLSFA